MNRKPSLCRHRRADDQRPPLKRPSERRDGRAGGRTQVEAAAPEPGGASPGRTADAHEPPRRSSSRAELLHDGEHWLLSARDDEDLGAMPPPGVVPALENAVAIIAYLNNKAPRTATLAEISNNLGISKSHCFSLLKTLVHFDWLHFEDATKAYRLQSGILRDASSLLHYSSMMGNIRPALAALVERVRLPCVLSQPLADDSFVVVDKFNAPHLMEVFFPIGHRFSRNACAQMCAYLAWQLPERIDRWFTAWEPVRYTERTPLDADAIRAEIEATRRRGYARSVGEFTDGLMAMALPIFNREGEVAFIFNCSSLIAVLQPREAAVAREMTRTAAEIHRNIGARTPPDFPSRP